MDSDDDIDYYPGTNLMLGDPDAALDNVDFEALLAGGIETIQEEGISFSDENPMEAEEAYPPEPKPLITHRATFERVQLKHIECEQKEICGIMLGSFSELEEIMEPIMPCGSVKKLTLRPGTGNIIEDGFLVRAHFILSAEFMDDLLDSTYTNDRVPVRFRVGRKEVIPMMDHGVKSMRVGEIAKFLSIPDYGYGKLGVPISQNKTIPPNARILIQMEVLEARPLQAEVHVVHMSHAERQELGWDELYKFVIESKKEANDYFRLEDFHAAVKSYLEALECVKDMHPVQAGQREECLKLRIQLCNNVSYANFKLGRYKKAYRFAKEATEVPLKIELKSKSNYRCAAALFELGMYAECHHYILKAHAINCSERHIQELLAQTRQKIEDASTKQKVMCARMMDVSLHEPSSATVKENEKDGASFG